MDSVRPPFGQVGVVRNTGVIHNIVEYTHSSMASFIMRTMRDPTLKQIVATECFPTHPFGQCVLDPAPCATCGRRMSRTTGQ